MLQCIFRLCVRVLKLGYNGVQRVGGVFGVVFGGGGQFFRRRRRRRGSCFFFVFLGSSFGRFFGRFFGPPLRRIFSPPPPSHQQSLPKKVLVFVVR